MSNEINAWHFLNKECQLRYRTQELVEVGKKYYASGPLAICKNGMHACIRVIDALQYAPGYTLCYVTCGGDIVQHGNELCSRWRRVERMMDATKLLHEFSCNIAEEMLQITKITEQQLFDAIATKRAWINGKGTDKDLDNIVFNIFEIRKKMTIASEQSAASAVAMASSKTVEARAVISSTIRAISNDKSAVAIKAVSNDMIDKYEKQLINTHEIRKLAQAT